MSLILTLTISNNYLSDSDNHFVFDKCGGSIGRNPDNDFVLPDPNHYLSRKHVIISYQDGAYYLTDNSENGVFLNHSNQAVGKNVKVRLNHGDCLSMGEYELDVSIAESEAGGAAEQYQTGPEWSGTEPLGPGPALSSSSWETADSQEGAPKILDGSGKSDLVPDYSGFDSQAARGATDRQGGAESDHSAAEQDYFAPPSMQEESQSRDWDRTGFAPAAEGGPEKPDWDKTDFVAPVRTKEQGGTGGASGESTAAHISAGPRSEVESVPATADVPPAEHRYDQVPPVPDAPIREDSVAPPPSRSQTKAETAVADVRSTGFQPGQATPAPGAPETEPVRHARQDMHGTSLTGEDALQAFFHGAGLQPEPLAPEAAEALMRLQGKLYREVVQGMMDLLRARFDLKNEIRARQTQVQIRENNPLKFIGQVDDALEYLFTKESSGFLGPEAAFHEAFQDIKDHQVAMIVGMRAAFNSLLQRFDPVQLESKFTKGSKIESLLPMYRQAECWERYQKWYSDITAAAEDDFQGLFGNEFARAYEDQMARLLLLRRKTEE